MARQPNYGFEKRRKEAERQARKDAKQEEKERRRREGTGDQGTDVPAEDAPPTPGPTA